MSDVVVDASALLAWLGRETGWEKVEQVFTDKNCKISTVNLSELIAKVAERIHDHDEIAAMISALPIEVVPFDMQHAFTAGKLRNVTRAIGLSLGDRACLALATTLNAVALTADRPWLSLDIGIQIECIR